MTGFKAARSFAAQMWRDCRQPVLSAGVLLLAVSLLDGVGLLLLLPLLGAAGMSADQDLGGHRLAEVFSWLPPGSRLSAALLVYLVVIAVASAARYASSRANVRVQTGFVRDQRVRLHERLLATGWAQVQQLRSHDISFQLTSNVDRLEQGAFNLIRGTTALMLMLAHLIVALILAPLLTGLVCIAGAIAAPLWYWHNRHVHALGARFVAERNRLHEISTDFVARQRQIRSFRQQTVAARDFSLAADAAANSTSGLYTTATVLSVAQQMGTAIVVAALIWIGTQVLHQPLAELLVFVFVVARLLPRLAELLGSVQGLIAVLPSYGSCRSFSDGLASPATAPATDSGTDVDRFDALEVVPGRADAAGFVYEGASLQVRKGELVVLIGATGSGKTTLCDILAGLLPVQQCLIDGRVADLRKMESLRHTTRYVPQDARPWQASVRAVLAWANPQADERAMWAALDEVGLTERIRQTGAGLDLTLADGGRPLSGGEVQRLMLAQAIITPVQLLVLDEITSALDAKTEEDVLGTLARIKAHTAIVLATHREQAIAAADRHVHLQMDRERQTVSLSSTAS